MFADEVISRYTRSDAITDGVLVDVTAAAKLAGLVLPTAMTATAHAELGGDDVEIVALATDHPATGYPVICGACAMQAAELAGHRGLADLEQQSRYLFNILDAMRQGARALDEFADPATVFAWLFGQLHAIAVRYAPAVNGEER